MSDVSQTTADMLELTKDELAEADIDWAIEHFGGEPLDVGIIRIVRILKEEGIETQQSCEGGEGHSYDWPSVDVSGQPWRALDLCNTYGLPVHQISELHRIEQGNPVEHFWRLEFSPHKLKDLYKQWYGDHEAMRTGIGQSRERQHLRHDAGELLAARGEQRVAKTIQAVLTLRPASEVCAIDQQPPSESSEAGPWVILRFGKAQDVAIFERTGAAFFINADGSVADDPFLEWEPDGSVRLFDERF